MKKIAIAICLLSLVTTSFSQPTHLIEDTVYRHQVKKQFENRRKLVSEREEALFSVFKNDLTTEQKEALEFLYAYMPLSDLADYDGDFFLKQIDIALEAKKTFSWGKEIPEAIFRHFVLPYRVNNEDVDTARVVFFQELKDRIKNLSMLEATLEVNHWCHEKVNYKASDIRTSAPLATLKTSWGRCGEESTFTVAAMRAVGIPARQVYTPRWAHTDDNHAWVEVFVDGKWQYLGACEPEPVLNKGWFDKPVKRAMMVHTRVFGNYKDTTNNLEIAPLFTKINTLEKYTKTKKLSVEVVDTENNPVSQATVRFGIYNYAEFYPMATLKSDKEGRIEITTGLGDLLISASKGVLYGEILAEGTNTGQIKIVLKKKNFKETNDSIEIIPPVELSVREIKSAQKKENDRLLAIEDSIRNAYKNSFMSEIKAKELADSLQLDTTKVASFIQKSQGNWKAIANYLQKNAKDIRVLDFLDVIAEKDLRDATESTLTAQLKATLPNKLYPYEVYKKGILNPRLQNELLRPWKPYLQAKFADEFAKNAKDDIKIILSWVKENIIVDDSENYARCPISPIGTYKLKRTDEQGRNLFFVALCRSLHIPARIHSATYQPQYYNKGKWIDVSFHSKENLSDNTASLTLLNDAKNTVSPEYYIHFTLQRFKDGYYQTLDYQDNKIFNTYPATLELKEGHYCLMTGHRDDNGSVRVLRKFFNLKKGEDITHSISLLPLQKKEVILGTMDNSLDLKDTERNTHSISSLIEEKGAIFAILEPSREPTRHIMVDIPLLKKEFDIEKVPFVFIIPKDKLTAHFSIENYKGLPKNSIFVIDEDNSITQNILKSLNITDNSFYPIVLFSNKKGNITFLSTGYRIGIGESLLKQLQ